MRILGIEFGSWSLKAVEMESRFRKVEILDLHEIQLPLEFTDSTQTYKKALEQLLGLLPSHPERIVTSLPSAQTAHRFLQMPVKQRRAVEKMYQFELEDSLPFKLDDSIIEHTVHRFGEGSLVFAAIAPKKHVTSFLEWLKGVGLDPDWLTFDGMGMIDLFFSSQPKKKDEEDLKPTLLLDLGHSKTQLAVVEAGRLEFFRTLSWGGAHINKYISQALGMSLEEAEHKKIHQLDLATEPQESANEAYDLFSAATQALVPLTTDITHSLVAFRTLHKKDVSRIKICGGTSLTRGFPQFLREGLNVPVEFIDTEKTITLKQNSKSNAIKMRFPEAVGRAFVFTRKSELLFNFRRGDLAKETSLTEVTAFVKNPSIIKILGYAAAFAAVLFVNIFLSGFVTDQEVKTARQELDHVFQETFQSVPSKIRETLTSKPEALQKFIDQKNRALKEKLVLVQKGKQSMLPNLLSLSNSFPKEVRVDINTVFMDTDKMTVEGVLYQGDLTAAQENLKNNPMYQNVELTRDGQRFTIRAGFGKR